MDRPSNSRGQRVVRGALAIAGAALLGIVFLHWSSRQEAVHTLSPVDEIVTATSIAPPAIVPGAQEPPSSLGERQKFEPWICRVGVVDGDNHPVAGAKLVLATSTHESVERLSDAAGVAEFSPEAGEEDLRLTAEAAGFTAKTVPVPRGTRQLVVVLERTTAMRGIVRMRGTQAAVAGARIAAWVQGSGPLSAADLRLEAGRAGRVFSAESDLSGEFELNGLDGTCTYSLLAGMPGLMAPATVDARSGPERVVIEVAWAYCTVTHLITPESPEFGVPEALRPSVRLQYSAVEALARHPMIPRAAAVLAGVSPEFLDRRPEYDVSLVVSDEKRASLGPCRVRVLVPGYETASTQYDMPRTDLGVGFVDVTLIANGAGWGALRIVPRNCTEELLACLSQCPCRMQLVLRSGSREDIYPFQLASAEPIRMSELPAGSYTAAISEARGLFKAAFAGEERIGVEIGEREAALDFDLANLGAVRFRFPERIAPWEPDRLPITLFDRSEPAPRGGTAYRGATFLYVGRSSPEVFYCLARTYQLRADDMTADTRGSVRIQAVEVPAGGVVVVDL